MDATRTTRRRRNAPRLANARPRRRAVARRRTRRSIGAPGFASAAMLKQALYAAAGIAAPALLTDVLLPKVGLTLTGIPRRLVQFLAPSLVLMAGGRSLLGTGAVPFIAGAYGVTALGMFNDLTAGTLLTGTAPALSAYAPAARLSAYAPAAVFK